MEKIEFWKKLSNYSIALCGIGLIIDRFWEEYVSLPMLIIWTGTIIVFVISEIMKFILKRKQ